MDLYNPPLQIVLIRDEVKDRGFRQPFFSQLLLFFPALPCDVSLDLNAYIVKQRLQVDNNVHENSSDSEKEAAQARIAAMLCRGYHLCEGKHVILDYRHEYLVYDI